TVIVRPARVERMRCAVPVYPRDRGLTHILFDELERVVPIVLLRFDDNRDVVVENEEVVCCGRLAYGRAESRAPDAILLQSAHIFTNPGEAPLARGGEDGGMLKHIANEPIGELSALVKAVRYRGTIGRSAPKRGRDLSEIVDVRTCRLQGHVLRIG